MDNSSRQCWQRHPLHPCCFSLFYLCLCFSPKADHLPDRQCLFSPLGRAQGRALPGSSAGAFRNLPRDDHDSLCTGLSIEYRILDCRTSIILSLGARGSGSLPDPRRGRAHDVHPVSWCRWPQGHWCNGIFVLLYGLVLSRPLTCDQTLVMRGKVKVHPLSLPWGSWAEASGSDRPDSSWAPSSSRLCYPLVRTYQKEFI